MRKKYVVNAATKERGDKHELRAFLLAEKLLNFLNKKYPDVVLFGRACLSGNSSPECRNIRDEYGEDLRIRIEARFPNGQIAKGYIIYDVKSSRKGVNERNKGYDTHNSYLNKPRKTANQLYARLSKALLVNENRSDRQISREMLVDLINANLLPRMYYDLSALDLIDPTK